MRIFVELMVKLLTRPTYTADNSRNSHRFPTASKPFRQYVRIHHCISIYYRIYFMVSHLEHTNLKIILQSIKLLVFYGIFLMKNGHQKQNRNRYFIRNWQTMKPFGSWIHFSSTTLMPVTGYISDMPWKCCGTEINKRSLQKLWEKKL